MPAFASFQPSVPESTSQEEGHTFDFGSVRCGSLLQGEEEKQHKSSTPPEAGGAMEGKMPV